MSVGKESGFSVRCGNEDSRDETGGDIRVGKGKREPSSVTAESVTSLINGTSALNSVRTGTGEAGPNEAASTGTAFSKEIEEASLVVSGTFSVEVVPWVTRIGFGGENEDSALGEDCVVGARSEAELMGRRFGKVGVEKSGVSMKPASIIDVTTAYILTGPEATVESTEEEREYKK